MTVGLAADGDISIANSNGAVASDGAVVLVTITASGLSSLDTVAGAVSTSLGSQLLSN